MRNKIVTIALLIVATLFTIQCSKEEVGGENNEQTNFIKTDTLQVQNRNNITLSTVWFDTSGTTSNYLVSQIKDRNRVFHAYNYSLIDSIIRVRVPGSGQANIFHTNTATQLVSNYDVFIYYKDNTTDTLLNHLAALRGARFKFIPTATTDLFNTGVVYTKKVRYDQTRSTTESFLENVGSVQPIYRWNVFMWNGFVWRLMDNQWRKPTRPFDFEFNLHNNF